MVTTHPDITDILERYNCPHTVPVVRMRFWGAINSPADLTWHFNVLLCAW